MKFLHHIGLYADDKGCSITVIKIDEVQNYHIVDECYQIEKVSLVYILASLEKFKRAYNPLCLYMNDLPSLIVHINRMLPIKTLELNLANGIFVTKGLSNDSKLKFHDEDLKDELNKFEIEIINHRCYSLFIGLQESKFYELWRMNPVASYSQGMEHVQGSQHIQGKKARTLRNNQTIWI